jgi:hypothetical protein
MFAISELGSYCIKNKPVNWMCAPVDRIPYLIRFTGKKYGSVADTKGTFLLLSLLVQL